MKQNPDVPCAQSKPMDLQDEVISALLWRAGELLDGRARALSRADGTPFQTALNSLLDLAAQDAELARLLEILPQALGNGLLLQTIFSRLFPTSPQPIVVTMPNRHKPKLQPRHIEVLLEMAKGRSKKEIAEHLFISPNIVKSHFNHIYAELGVNSPQEAVVKATALGLMPFNMVDLLAPQRDSFEVDFDALAYSVADGLKVYDRYERTQSKQQLAALGLLLLLLPPMMAHVEHLHTWHVQHAKRGVIFELTPDGQVVRALDMEGRLKYPMGIAFAPPAAERHGFRKGNLFVGDHGNPPDALNHDRILELTPDGQCVRAFTGGKHFALRLIGAEDIAFTLDGRMLTISGSCALLEYTQGGGAIRRLSHLVPEGLTVDQQRGTIYVSGGWAGGSSVHVFSPQGDLLRKIGEAEGYAYRGVAVDDEGNLFVANDHTQVIEVFDAAGVSSHTISDGDLNSPERLALSPNGRLYVTQRQSPTVKVFNLYSGAFLFSFTAPDCVWVNNLTFAPNGNLFVTAVQD